MSKKGQDLVREMLDRAQRVLPKSSTAAEATGSKAQAGNRKKGDSSRLNDATVALLAKQFQQKPDGLWWQPPSPDKNGVHVCGPLEAVARTRDEHGENWGVLLSWKDGDGRQHQWPMPRGMLAGDGGAIREHLLGRGLYVAPDRQAREALVKWLSIVSPAQGARCVGRIGWHTNANGHVFVLPDAVYGAIDTEKVLLQSSSAVAHAFNQMGELAAWKSLIARRCVGNTRLLLAVSAGFAASLLEISGEESGGVNFQGGSRIGKSTTLRVAGSVWGGGPHGYLRQWRSTSNGLEGIAAAHCDALLALDELGQMDPREAGDVAYMLANGAGKSRAGRDGGARAALFWRTLILSTGETSLADLAQEAGRRAKAGQEVRLVDVPADAGGGLGIFEELHGEESADALARALRDATAHNYGTPIHAFLGALGNELHTKRDELFSWLGEQRRLFSKKHVPAGASGQVLSVAGRFALIAAAGELATRYAITGWEPGTAEWGVGICFRAWLERRGGVGAREEETGVGQVRAFVEQHGSARFEVWDDARKNGDNGGGAQRILNRAGWKRRDQSGAWEYFVPPETWRNEVCRGLDPRMVVAALEKREQLIVGADGKHARSLKIPGYGKMRVYHLASSIIGDIDTGSPADELPAADASQGTLV